jgi:hypothetical protein
MLSLKPLVPNLEVYLLRLLRRLEERLLLVDDRMQEWASAN